MTNAEGTKCRAVVVPSFHVSHQAVLVDLKTLEAQPIHFRGLMVGMEEDEGSQ